MVIYSNTISGTTYTIDAKTDWLSSDYINFADFNRLENNIIVLRNMVIAASRSLPSITSETGRTVTFIDYLSSINRIENNLSLIYINSFFPSSFVGASWFSGKGFDYLEANRLENNVLTLFLGWAAVFDSYVYAGQINSGYTRGQISLV